MCLRFVFLLITRMTSWLQLSRREEAWQTPEILLLRRVSLTMWSNSIMERWIGGCRRELLDRTLIWNQAHLRRILRQYQTHHNHHRQHGRWTPLRR
jgi:hypothetical protein